MPASFPKRCWRDLLANRGRTPVAGVCAWQVSNQNTSLASSSVIGEAEVVLRVNGKVYRQFHCLPSHLEELALGHLISQGFIISPGTKREQKGLEVWAYVEGHRRRRPPKIVSAVTISGDDVFRFVKMLRENCPLHEDTGGTHVVGIFQGALTLFVEDVSRHCAIDKAFGLALSQGLDLTQSAVVTSCRQTLSTIEKAIHAQTPIVISIAAVTSLAIERANLFGITLIGLAGQRQFNIYCHQGRITQHPH